MTIQIHTYTNGKTSTGYLFHQTPATLLDEMEHRGFEVRRWGSIHDAKGIFRVTKTGAWRAVGQFSETQSGYCVIYRCMQPR